ncbi:MAG TPA: aminotransferase class V-fold PLP-dependent enzyme [Acidimicrobiales bacterium]|nr:aminotransferase class V-fold PLP-dependent enzyme [Acidimicrobiales bacterium]
MTGRHYLDHASTSPARPEVVEAMLPWLAGGADPGRVHTEGRVARGVVEDARERVATLLGARAREVVFTSGATEAIATAVASFPGHQVCPAVEHSAVRDASGRHPFTLVGVDGLGRVDPEEVVAACRERGVLVHVDTAAAAGHVPVDFAAVGADLMSVSAHKLGGPQGVGALLVRRGLRLRPLLLGGDQERSRQAGMENVAGIAGFGAAAEVVATDGRLAAEAGAARALTSRALEAATALEGVTPFGDVDDRLPHLVCLGVAGVEAQAVLLGLDQAGVAVHSGSACSSESLEPSPVLEAMGVDARHSLRVSVGWSTTGADVDAFCAALPNVLGRLRELATGS